MQTDSLKALRTPPLAASGGWWVGREKEIEGPLCSLGWLTACLGEGLIVLDQVKVFLNGRVKFLVEYFTCRLQKLVRLRTRLLLQAVVIIFALSEDNDRC